MPKITRKNQKIFGASALTNQLGVFGSLAQGAPAFSKDPETLQSLAKFDQGWFNAILGNSNPAIEDINTLFYVGFYQLAYILQAGVAEWSSLTTYYVGSLVNDGNGNIYKSVQNDNLNHAVTDPAWWTSASGAGAVSTIVSTSQTIYANRYYLGNTVSGAITLTLEPGATGSRTTVVDGKGNAGVNFITVMPGTGQSINGGPINQPVYINAAWGGYIFAWDGATWVATKIGGLGGSGSGLTPVAQTTSGTSVINTIERLIISGPITRTLPPVPSTGGIIDFVDAGESFSTTNFLRISPATGEAIDGYPINDSLVLRKPRSSVRIFAAAGDTKWYVQYYPNTIPQGGQLPGNQGIVPTTNALGEMPSMTARAGTGGSSYSVRTTTAVTSAGVGVFGGISLKKGLYLFGYTSSFYQTSGSSVGLVYYVIVGGTGVTTAQNLSVASGPYVTVSQGPIPILITTDDTIIDVRMGTTAGSTLGSAHECWIARI